MDDGLWDRLRASPDARERPLGELITGLDLLTDHPIPYEGMPRRVKTVYAQHFRHWADLSAQSFDSLHRYPRAGTTTVVAFLAAARRAATTAGDPPGDAARSPAEAIERVLDRLDAADRILLSDLAWSSDPSPRPEVAAQLGLSPRTLVRRLARARARFDEQLADPSHRDVLAHAEELRRALGPLTPVAGLKRALRDRRLDPTGEAGRALLHVAGPYRVRGDWALAGAAGEEPALRAVDDVLTRVAAPTTAALTEALAGIGMPADTARAYLSTISGLRPIDDQWVHWGDSIADQGWAVLQVRRTPLTADDVAAAIDERHTRRSIPEALSKDARFHRVTRRTWALREWGLPEYGGLSAEVGARIDAAGGRIRIADVVADVLATFPDVTASSVRSYVATPAFVTQAGWVRRRTDDDPWPAPPEIRTARGAYVDGPRRLRLAVPVTGDLLRGSGQRIPPAVVAHFGMTPGASAGYLGPVGEVVLDWRLDHPGGPSAGSVRALAGHAGAGLGDELLLVIDQTSMTIDALRIAADEDPRRRLRLLLGRAVPDPVAALARGLACSRDEVPEVLRRRGEFDLLALIDPG